MPVRRLLAAVLLAGAFVSAFASASLAQSARTRTDDRAARSEGRDGAPSELWRKFPLGESTVDGTSTRRLPSASRPAAATAPDDSSEGETQMLLVGVIALSLLLLAFGATLLLKSRQRRLLAESRSRLFEIMFQPAPAEQRIAQAQAFAAGVGCDKVSAHRPRARGKPVNEQSQGQGSKAEAAAGSRDYAQLGDRVAAVLQAAEEAAEQIRLDAGSAADELLAEAKREAQRVRVEADTEAKNTREAVESYATNHRREAEEKAAKTLTEAESQARASREAAEAMAKRIEESARTLEEEVREQERMIRGRMQRYLAALRDVSGQIEDVLGETERGEPTLVEALDERTQNASG
jgi:hypothetical protein